MTAELGGAVGEGLSVARERVRRELSKVATTAGTEGMARVGVEGQLIRPLVAYAGGRALSGDPLPPAFWNGALAVQMAHEASLVHDDIVDGADTRRGRASVVAAAGVGGALILGDHLLTSAYRLAARSENAEFVALFARSVERTVAGEIEQGRTIGAVLSEERYEAIVLGKAGELLGCALALAPALEGRPDYPVYFELGRRLGLLYQRLDDLLDYCVSANTGKPPVGDFAQRRWTWPLAELPAEIAAAPFDRTTDEVLRYLRSSRVPDECPLMRCIRRIDRESAALLEELKRLLPADELISGMITDWVARGRAAVERELEIGGRSAARARSLPAGSRLSERVPTVAQVLPHLAAHSRTFRFAAKFLPPRERERIARVYAFCRVTDDLADGPGCADSREVLLDEWAGLAAGAYHGQVSGIELLDTVMCEMRDAGVPYEYAADLLEGMRMDLRGTRYERLSDLKLYTYRVASVVGLWLTRLMGVHDPRILAEAARLGHAMQITNILRDVGEDWRRGRLYIPRQVLVEHGLTELDVAKMAEGRQPVGSAYRALLEHLLGAAETDYRLAFAAIPALPDYFQRSIAVAAYCYRGIHGAIRRNGYDNLRLRAQTSRVEKVRLACGALSDLGRARQVYLATVTAAPAPATAALAGAAGGCLG